MANQISKAEFITRQIRRTHNKRFENYVITRIWHGIDSLDVKLVTQQYVMRENGCALLDAYFPQFNIGIEVDEAQHKGKENIKLDRKREIDVIRAIGCTVYRVDATESLIEINKSCDYIVLKIKERMKTSEFDAWNLEDEFNAKQFIKKGYISIDDNAGFRRHSDALECFGLYYKNYQKSGIAHPTNDDEAIWFPKMHGRTEWINLFDEKEETIYEVNEDESKKDDNIDRWLSEESIKRIVFVYSKDSLGMVLYRFKGVFQLDREATINEKRAVWRRISKVVETTDKVIKRTK